MQVILPIVSRERDVLPCKRGGNWAAKENMGISSCSLVPSCDQNLGLDVQPLCQPWHPQAHALPYFDRGECLPKAYNIICVWIWSVSPPSEGTLPIVTVVNRHC